MRAVDTNVLVRLITRDDSRQVAAAEDFVEGGAWVSILTLAEAAWVLNTVYELTAPDLAAAIEMLLDHQSLVLQDSDAVASALGTFRQWPAMGFTDCLMLELARKVGHLPFGTFHRNLSRLDGAVKL